MVKFILKKNSFILIAAVFLLLALSPAYGKEEAHLEADKVYLDEDGWIIAEGNVKMSYEGVLIEADQAEIHKKERIVRAFGNVYISRNEGEKSIGEFLTYDLRTKEGTIFRAEGQTKNFQMKGEPTEDYIFFRGEEVYNETDNLYLDTGQFTTCDQEHPHEHYRILTTDTEIIPDDKLVAHDVYIVYKGRKIFWVPVVIVSLKEQEVGRQNFLPQMGYNETEGFFVKHNFNYYINPRAYGSIKVDYASKLGVTLGFETYYKVGDTGQGYISYLRQNGQSDIINNQFNFRHSQNLSDNLTMNFTASVTKNSGLTFTQDANINTKLALNYKTEVSNTGLTTSFYRSSSLSENLNFNLTHTQKFFGVVNTNLQVNSINQSSPTSDDRNQLKVLFTGTSPAGPLKMDFKVDYSHANYNQAFLQRVPEFSFSNARPLKYKTWFEIDQDTINKVKTEMAWLEINKDTVESLEENFEIDRLEYIESLKNIKFLREQLTKKLEKEDFTEEEIALVLDKTEKIDSEKLSSLETLIGKSFYAIEDETIESLEEKEFSPNKLEALEIIADEELTEEELNKNLEDMEFTEEEIEAVISYATKVKLSGDDLSDELTLLGFTEDEIDIILDNAKFGEGTIPINTTFSLGYYDEQSSETTDFRGNLKLNMNKTFNFGTQNSLSWTSSLDQTFYGSGEARYILNNQFVMNNTFGEHFRSQFNFTSRLPNGYSPFSFDGIGSTYNALTYNMEVFNQNSWRLRINTGYNITSESYNPLVTRFDFRPKDNLIFNFAYAHDLNGSGAQTFDTNLDLQLHPEWRFQYASTYNFSSEKFGTQDFKLVKDCHCWLWTLGYRTYKKELIFQISVKAFPSQSFAVGTSEDGPILPLLNDIQNPNFQF